MSRSFWTLGEETSLTILLAKLEKSQKGLRDGAKYQGRYKDNRKSAGVWDRGDNKNRKYGRGVTSVYPEDVPRRPPRTVWGIRLGMRRVYFGVAASGCASVLKLPRRSFDVWRSGEPATLQGVFLPPPPPQRLTPATISTRSPVIGAGGWRGAASQLCTVLRPRNCRTCRTDSPTVGV